ncbi:MAG: helix-turn-helix domain-containing protein [Terriglobales bacterium]
MAQFDDYVTDVLMRDLAGHDRRPASFLVYLWLAAEQARQAGPVQASYQQLAECVGISKSSAQAAVRWLVRRKLLSVRKANVTAMPVYSALFPWRRGAPR